MSFKILALNPGSTSTKMAIFEDDKATVVMKVAHPLEDIARFKDVIDQLDWRLELIMATLKENNVDVKGLDAVVGRGGLVRPIPSGVYEVNTRMIYDLRNAQLKHASNLGGLLADQIAQMAGVKAYIADPVVVDEMEDVARITGMPMCPRKSIFHALNQKATARLHCEKSGLKYDEARLIVAHMGGGISVAAHKNGRVVDVNNALDGDGPFSPDRAGSIPACDLIKICYSGQYKQEELLKQISSKSGMVAYLGTNSVQEVCERIAEGENRSKVVLEAMNYNISKQIGAMAAALAGKVDGIILTGGIAYNEPVTDYIVEHCSFIAPVTIYPGENELESLAMNALSVLNKSVEPKIYE